MLRYIAQARDRGLGVIFITHNPHHAYPVGDRFVILNRGRLMGDVAQGRDHAATSWSSRCRAAPSSTRSSTSCASSNGCASTAATQDAGSASASA